MNALVLLFLFSFASGVATDGTDYVYPVMLYTGGAVGKEAGGVKKMEELMTFVNSVLKKETGIHLHVRTNNLDFSSMIVTSKDDAHLLYEHYSRLVVATISSIATNMTKIFLLHSNVVRSAKGYSMMTGQSSPPWEVGRNVSLSGIPSIVMADPVIVATYNQSASTQQVGYNIISHILYTLGFGNLLEADEHGPGSGGHGCNCPNGPPIPDTAACILYTAWYDRNFETNSGIRDPVFPQCIRRLVQKDQVKQLIKLQDFHVAVTQDTLAICGNGIVESVPPFNETCDCPASRKFCHCDLRSCKQRSTVTIVHEDEPVTESGDGSQIWTIVSVIAGIIGLVVAVVIVVLVVRKRRQKPKTKMVIPVVSLSVGDRSSSTDSSAGLSIWEPVKKGAKGSSSRKYSLNSTISKTPGLPSVPIPPVVIRSTDPDVVLPPLVLPPRAGSASSNHSHHASKAKVKAGPVIPVAGEERKGLRRGRHLRPAVTPHSHAHSR